jgi:hypothetical protein
MSNLPPGAFSSKIIYPSQNFAIAYTHRPPAYNPEVIYPSQSFTYNPQNIKAALPQVIYITTPNTHVPPKQDNCFTRCTRCLSRLCICIGVTVCVCLIVFVIVAFVA